MRLRLSLTLSIRREPKPEPPEPTTFESQGSLVENIGHPRYIGFQVENDRQDT